MSIKRVETKGTPIGMFLEEFRKIGGALDFGFYTDLDEGDAVRDLHTEAVGEFMSGLGPKTTFSLEKATKKLIGKEQFLGPYYCHEREEILMQGKTNDFNGFVFAGLDEENEKNIHGDRYGSFFEREGFCYAFYDPPYCTWSREGIYKLFHIFIKSFLNSFNDELEIYEWSDDWSNYFDMGKEWWGCFFWTIHNKSKDILIVIGGSTTD